MIKGACCVAASVLLFLPLALWLYSANRMPAAQRDAIAQDFVVPGHCKPQPGERLAFLAGVVFLPAALFGLALARRRWEHRLPALRGFRYGVGALLAAGLAAYIWLAQRTEEYFHVRRNVFFTAPLLAVPLLPAALAAMRWDLGGRRWVRPLLHAAALGLAGLVGLACVFSDRSPDCGLLHFTAVFFPVVQVHLGKALLIDCASQYGLYPHLLQPLFAAVGLSVLSFTAVMGLLTAGAYLALWRFLARAAKNRTAAFLGFGTLLFNGWFCFARCANFDLYFQYMPIRFVFPALLVPLAWRYLRRPGPRLYWGLTALLAVGVLWNLDSGLPALLSWTAMLCFRELFAGAGWRDALRRILGHAAAAGAVLAAVVLLYTVAIRLAYGHFPDYRRFLAYQQIYFMAGYCKTAIPFPGTWVLAALVYLAGFAYAARAATSGRLRDPAGRGARRAALVFLLSVLGFGLSSYYQAMCNPMSLMLVWWPALLLLALFLDDLLTRLKERPTAPGAWAAATAIGWFVVGSSCSLIPDVRFVGAAVADRLRGAADRKVIPQREEEAVLLRRLVPPGGRVLVASAHSALIHLASGRAAPCPASLFQMARMEDFRDLGRALADHPSTCVLIDKPVLARLSWLVEDHGLGELVGLLREKYEATAATEQSILFARRTDGQASPDPGDDAAFQVHIRDGALGAGMTFSPCSLHAPWSLEAVVEPTADEVPNAALVGNHPGRGIGGFVLQMESPGSCALVAGDGKAWRVVCRFGVRPGDWNHLAVVDDGQAVTAYADGRPVASEAAAGLEIEDSPLPLQVGNWCGNDRPFHGLIRVVRILNRAISPQEIAEHAERVRRREP